MTVEEYANSLVLPTLYVAAAAFMTIACTFEALKLLHDGSKKGFTKKSFLVFLVIVALQGTAAYVAAIQAPNMVSSEEQKRLVQEYKAKLDSQAAKKQ